MKRLFKMFLMTVALALTGSVALAQPAPQPRPIQIPAPAAAPAVIAAPAPTGAPVYGGAPVHGGQTIYTGGSDHGINGCGPNGCGPQGCCEPQPECGNPGNFYAAIGLVVAKPYFESNPAFSVTTINFNAAGTGQFATRNSDYTYDFDVTPRVILGWVSESGLGARVSWWLYDHNSDTIALENRNGPAGGAVVVINAPNANLGIVPGQANVVIPAGSRESWVLENSTRFDVWDVDATQALDLGCVDLVLGGGIRYTHMNQATRVNRVLHGPGIIDTDSWSSNRSFNGLGPTVFLDLRAPVGEGMGLAFYSNARLGALFGRNASEDYLLNRTNVGLGVGPIVNPPTDTITRNSSSNDGILAFAEGEIGVEWAGQMEGFQPFVRVGLTGSIWHGAGNTANASNPQQSALGFLGYSILAGVNY